MNTRSAPPPTPEDLATERLVAAVESAIQGIQERLPNQLQGERPRTIFACWVDDPSDIRIHKDQEQQQPRPPGTAHTLTAER